MDVKNITFVSTEGDNIEIKEEFKDLAATVAETLESGDEMTIKGFAISTATYNIILAFLESCNYKPSTYDWYVRGVPKPTGTNADLNETDRNFCEKFACGGENFESK